MNHLIKRIAIAFLAAFIIATNVQAQGTPSEKELDVLLDRVLVIVDEDVIMSSELAQRLQLVEQQISARDGRPVSRETLFRPVLERMVMERLQLQEARRLGIQVDDISLNNAIGNIARENGMTIGQFRDRLVAEGMDFAAFREQIRDEMTISQLHRRRVDTRIQVSDQEIDDLIASESGAIDRNLEYRLQHLLISLPEGATPEQIRTARARAEEIRREAQEGGNFSQLVLRESEGQTALDGGDLGWRSAAQVPTLFSRHVVLMREGEISEVIRSPSGFHLVKLAERRGNESAQVQQTRARHILVSPSEILTAAEAQQRLQTLYNRILDGAEFAELARAHSDDPGSATRGGDLGWIDPGMMVPEFEDVLNRTAVGEVSQPFASPFGFHILQVTERRSHDSSREMMRAQARDMIRERKREDELEIWLRRLRDESFIEYRLDGPQVAGMERGRSSQ